MANGNSSEGAASDCRASFAARHPSAGWESIQVPGLAGVSFWAWYKPANAPTGLMFQVPPEALQAAPQLTLRTVIHAAGLDAACIPMCSLFGFSFPGQAGTAPYFDQPLTIPAPGTDPNIVAYVDAPSGAQYGARPAPTVNEAESTDSEVLEICRNIERDWKGSLKNEKQLEALHKQLIDMQTRLNTLNRDLGPEERMCAERRDLDDWQEARRALRDAALRLSRFIREFDAGETTYAGKKRWFQEIYEDYVQPRQPFDGMRQAQQEFEVYRKMTQNLASNMQSVWQSASQEGERRAQTVLNAIAVKVRAAKTGRG